MNTPRTGTYEPPLYNNVESDKSLLKNSSRRICNQLLNESNTCVKSTIDAKQILRMILWIECYIANSVLKDPAKALKEFDKTFGDIK